MKSPINTEQPSTQSIQKSAIPAAVKTSSPAQQSAIRLLEAEDNVQRLWNKIQCIHNPDPVEALNRLSKLEQAKKDLEMVRKEVGDE